MSIDKLLEYQKIDKELVDIENTLVKSEERQRLAKLTGQVKAAQEAVKKLQNSAAILNNEYVAMKQELDKVAEELDGFDGILDGAQDSVEMGHYLKKVEEQAEKLAQLDKNASNYAAELEKISEQYKKVWSQGVKATADQKAAKAEYDAVTDKLRPQVDSIQKQLAALAAQIPESLLEHYKALRSTRKLPAVVPYDAQNKICGGCRMELANDTRSKLKNPGDYTECPNCRRILYVPEQ